MPAKKNSTKRSIPPKQLREIWDQIPDMIECKGRCANSCGPIDCSTLERKLIEGRTGRKLDAPGPELTCSMLKNGRCTVYSIRPIICRLWGVVESMPCPHGCQPERRLSDREGFGLMAKAFELAGDDEGEMLREAMANMPQEVLDKMKAWSRGAPDLGGHIFNREKANKEFIDALKNL